MTHTFRPTAKARTFTGHEDLARCPGLSLMAMGVGVHLRTLPEGAATSVQALAAQLGDSEFEIAAALQELRDHGFLPKA
ncbi:hypothetical protein ABTY98_10245 [Streptomyces sp. NPDC096040]|uniref:hypothetical protein n=1 Tax=Streptomyces sp. NPDC096040 TaxID=3155541 RepID=UPI00331C1A73